MANLIITIISIALVAIAAVMGTYYGGQAFENAQINATANAIMNEAQQILQAERLWSVNNGQTDISGMGAPGASGTGISLLVSGNELAEWPSFGGTIGYSQTLTNPGPQPSYGLSYPGTAATTSTGVNDIGCYSINGYYGDMNRFLISYNNANYVVYNFGYGGTSSNCSNYTDGFASSTTDVSQINHPIVKIAKAINAALNQIPANANNATMQYIGLPAPPAGSSTANNVPNVYPTSSAWNQVYIDANNTLQSNYCYFSYPTAPPYYFISCVFGPS